MIVVVDTNIFVISLTSKSPFHKIYQALVKGEFQLAVSNDILLEYVEIIERKYSQRVAHEFMNLLAELPNVLFTNVYYNWNLISSDNEDNKFVDCAIAAAADFIVTEDGHFDVLARVDFPRMNVIGLEEFLKKV